MLFHQKDDDEIPVSTEIKCFTKTHGRPIELIFLAFKAKVLEHIAYKE